MVLICSQNQFCVQHFEKLLERKTSQLFPIIIYGLHWVWIPGDPYMININSNLIARLLKEFCYLEKISGGVNAHKTQ